jgi:hypothetical protein
LPSYIHTTLQGCPLSRIIQLVGFQEIGNTAAFAIPQRENVVINVPKRTGMILVYFFIEKDKE